MSIDPNTGGTWQQPPTPAYTQPPTQPTQPQYGQQNPAAPPYGAPQPGFTPTQPSSTLAVWAMVLGLVGLLFGWCMLGVPCLAAVITGHLAVTDTKNNAKTGRGMAVAGLALGYVALAPAIILFFWLIVGGGIGAATPTP